jgi:hypothetical protein
MNEHPDELLASYVDDDLGRKDRALAEAHLAVCERCRLEVSIARRARAALVSLPEVRPPIGMRFRVLRAAPRREPARAWRAVAGVAVAASLIAGAVVVFQRVDIGGGAAQSPADGARAPAPPEAREVAAGEADQAAGEQDVIDAGGDELLFRSSGARYDATDMPAVGERLVSRVGRALDQGFPATPRTTRTLSRPAGARIARALECTESAIHQQDLGIPFSFEEASFLDDGTYTPGYVAAFLRAPSRNATYDSLTIWVVDATGCDRFFYGPESFTL